MRRINSSKGSLKASTCRRKGLNRERFAMISLLKKCRRLQTHLDATAVRYMRPAAACASVCKDVSTISLSRTDGLIGLKKRSPGRRVAVGKRRTHGPPATASLRGADDLRVQALQRGRESRRRAD